MSEVPRPGNLSHLERLIDAWSREDPTGAQATAGRLRRLVGISVLAAILDGLDQESRLAFKGGASLELRFGPAARATRDVDALVDVSFLAATRAACEDTFTYRARHAWPPELPAWESWEQVWDSLSIPDHARSPYHEARQRVTGLIARIARA